LGGGGGGGGWGLGAGGGGGGVWGWGGEEFGFAKDHIGNFVRATGGP